MSTRYLLQHEEQTRPALMVEVVKSANEPTVQQVKRDMHDMGCAHALVIDETRVRVLRDAFVGMEESSIEEEAILDSRLLLGDHGPLVERVGRWLDGMSSNWHEVLPKEEWASVLLYDVVPAASGSLVERIDSDAA